MTPRVKTAVNTSESGYVIPAPTSQFGPVGQMDGWINWDPFEKVPELQWPQSVAIYSQMDGDDSRVTSLLEAIAGPILETPKRIDPNGAPDEVVAFISRSLNLPIKGDDAVKDPGRRRDRFSFDRHLEECVYPTFQYGHSCFEQIYVRGDDGLFRLRKLAPRPQWTIQRFNVAVDGGLDSVQQLAPAASQKVVWGVVPAEIPINRLVLYPRNMRPGYWMGRSILRSGYKHWRLKNEIMRIQAAAARRNGMGVPVGTVDSSLQADVNKMQKLASGFTGGMNSGVGLGTGQTLELLGVKGNMPDTQRMLEYHDKMIALGGLAHFLNLDGKGGSYALANVLYDPFVTAENAALKFFIRIANEHIVEDLVDINFGADVGAPLIVADEIGTQQEASASALQMLVNAGLLSPDVLVEQTLRQRLNLPAKPPGEPAATGPVAPLDHPVPNPSDMVAASALRHGRRAPGPGQEALWP